MKAMQLHHKLLDFCLGAIVTFASYLKTFILQAHCPSPSEFFIKMVIGILLAICGGFATWLAKDFYTVLLQQPIKKFFSKFKNRKS